MMGEAMKVIEMYCAPRGGHWRLDEMPAEQF
jgi:hypothetical protein